MTARESPHPVAERHVDQLVAYSAFALTVGLSVTRPRIGGTFRIAPAHAAGISVLGLLAVGIVTVSDVAGSALELWRPLLTIVCIMVMTAVAHELGVLRRLGSAIFARPDQSPGRLFLAVFVLTAITSTVLNNDAAILLLTPLVLGLVAERYPDHDELHLAFAFAVFMAVGVAPLVISNPMNMIVAAYAGLDFNAYTATMAPIALAGWVAAFAVLRWLFRRELRQAPAPVASRARRRSLDGAQKGMLGILAATIGSYPLVATVDSGAIWVVAVAGAAAALLLLRTRGRAGVGAVLRDGVAWDVLLFLLAVFVLALGLRNVGLVERLAGLYAGAGTATIGVAAAIGSAGLNNHPMAIINMLALESTPGAGLDAVLAVLIGGDLGPRLLPIGSLAGLLWLEACRRQGVRVPITRFVAVGVAVTVPTLALSLLLLRLG